MLEVMFASFVLALVFFLFSRNIHMAKTIDDLRDALCEQGEVVAELRDKIANTPPPAEYDFAPEISQVKANTAALRELIPADLTEPPETKTPPETPGGNTETPGDGS